MPRQSYFTSAAADPDTLRLRHFGYTEELGRLFRLEAELLSDQPAVDFDALIGEAASVALLLPDGSYRHFSGIVSEFAQDEPLGRFARYRATLVPWFWLLTRTSDCRIFQTKSVPEIVKEVFRSQGMSDCRFEIQGTYEPREYCVQYRETDFEFVSRLLEEEGIYYYWRHEESKHEMVLVDRSTAHEPFPGFERLEYRPVHTGPTAGEFVWQWRVRRRIEPSIAAHTDYNFEKSQASLLAKASITRGHAGPAWEVFDYPGEYQESAAGDQYARVRIEELQARYELASGVTESRGLSAGCVFELDRHPRGDQNRSYLTVSLTYTGDCEEHESAHAGHDSVVCHFDAIPATEQFRSERITRRPIVRGPQTAMVVGPAGEEIHVDEHGRVKVQFHWDREGARDQNSSCWIRVSQLWAGHGWGAMYIPRIGQEVIVEFLEGNPDCPIITGRVYNGDAQPPYALPANSTRSTIKSNSSKGGGGSNEIRFEDKKGSEEVFIHAQKDKNVVVENDRTEQVGRDESIDIGHDRTESVGHDETISIGNNRTESVEKNETISIGQNRSTDVGKNEDVTVGKDRTESVGKNESITIGENRQEKVGKDEKLEVGGHRTVSVGKDDKEQVGGKYALVAGDEIVLKTGDASITLKKDGTIQIKGKDITISGSGKIGVKASGDVTLKGSKVTAN